MAKIAHVDNVAMNHLMKVEASRKGIKLAAEDPQAFKDHEEYLSVVDSVLAEDKRESWSPNDPLRD